MTKAFKYLRALTIAEFWPALKHGVMPGIEHLEAITLVRPRTVIDVGANKGQFSLAARRASPGCRIYAFEPIPSEVNIFRSLISQPASSYQAAVAEETGERKLFLASRLDSSSLLASTTVDQRAYNVHNVGSIDVASVRLDDFIDQWEIDAPALLKIDVQGGELAVLRSSERLLRKITAVYCEVSFVELYDGQPLAEEIVSFLFNQEFSLKAVFNVSVTSLGQTQADFLFVRKLH